MMVQLLKPHEVKIITKEGECQVSITLDLNINLNGEIAQVTTKVKQKEEEKEENVWEIPDFSSGEKINFGKNER
jgi:hypothetical protein